MGFILTESFEVATFTAVIERCELVTVEFYGCLNIEAVDADASGNHSHLDVDPAAFPEHFDRQAKMHAGTAFHKFLSSQTELFRVLGPCAGPEIG